MKQREKLVVIEMTDDFGSAALAGKILSDIGCQVIKLEEEQGDSLREGIPYEANKQSYLFDLVSATKYSIGGNFNQTKVHSLLDFLFAKADILIVDQYYKEQLTNIGFSLEHIHKQYPHMTVGAVTPFGLTGPLSSWKGNEEIIQAITGVMSVSGHINAGPTRISSNIVTHATSLFAVSSVLSDIINKQKTKEGKLLDVNMFNASLSYLTTSFPVYFLTGKSPQGIGNAHTMVGPWNSFKCNDGWIVICSGSHPIWTRLCKAIEREDLISDPRFEKEDTRMENIKQLEQEIEQWTMDKTAEQIETIMDENAVPCGPILSLEEVFKHDFFKEKEMLIQDKEKWISGFVSNIPSVQTDITVKMSKLGEGTSYVLVDCLEMSTSLYSDLLNDRVIFEGGN